MTGKVKAIAVSGTRHPDSLGPNPRANGEIGAARTLLDCAWVHVEQTRILARFEAARAGHDLILSPASRVSPFPWTQWHAGHVDARRQDTYHRWPTLACVPTLSTLPPLAWPSGGIEELRRPRPAIDRLGPVDPASTSIVTAPPTGLAVNMHAPGPMGSA